MPESKGTFEKIKLTVASLPVIIAPILGATVLSEVYSQSYTPKEEQEIDSNIHEMDETLREVLADQQCNVGVYDYLRSDNSFPDKKKEIDKVLKVICSETNLDSTTLDKNTRLVESYMGDIKTLESKKSDILDKKIVSTKERFWGGAIGLMIGGYATGGLMALIKKPKNREKSR